MHVPAAMNTVTKNMTMNMVVPAVMTMTMKDTNTKNTTMSMAAPAADTITNMSMNMSMNMITVTNMAPVAAADMTMNTITDMNTAPAAAAVTTMDMITTTKAMTTGMITAAADVAAAKRWKRNITTTLLTRKWKNTKTMPRT